MNKQIIILIISLFGCSESSLSINGDINGQNLDDIKFAIFGTRVVRDDEALRLKREIWVLASNSENLCGVLRKQDSSFTTSFGRAGDVFDASQLVLSLPNLSLISFNELLQDTEYPEEGSTIRALGLNFFKSQDGNILNNVSGSGNVIIEKSSRNFLIAEMDGSVLSDAQVSVDLLGGFKATHCNALSELLPPFDED